MVKKFKNVLLTLGSISAILVPTMVPAIAMAAPANIKERVCQGLNLEVNATGTCTANDATNNANSLITSVIDIFSIVVGVVAVIMIIFGGFKYITSGGDSGNVSSAKNTILYALIGLVIVALAQIIVKFVFSKTANSA